MTPDRVDRVAAFIRTQLAEVIRNKMSDPRLPLLTVTDARVSRDLAVADVYISAFADRGAALTDRKSALTDRRSALTDQRSAIADVGSDAKAEMVAVLNHAAGFLRSSIARRHDLRTTPKLRFHYDDLAEQAPHLEALIDRALRTDAKGRKVAEHAS